MSNLPQQIARNQYIADGITTVYAYTFLVPSANSLVNDIAVYVTLSGNLPNPVTDIQPLNTAYTVQNAGVITGGTITFQPGYIPPISSIITVVRNMYVGIDTDFAVAQNFNGANLDLALERLVLIMQEYFTGLMYTTLTYPINAILPQANLNLLPQLPNNYVWVGLGGKVVATELITQIPLNSLSSPFLLNGVAVTTTGTQLNYLNFSEGTTGTGNLVYSNSPTINNPTLTGVTFGSGTTFTDVTINNPTVNGGTFNQPVIYQPIIYGDTDGTDAAAGVVGEIISQVTLATSVNLTTSTPANICTITLTPGRWYITGTMAFDPTGGTINFVQFLGGISSVSGTLPGTYSVTRSFTQYNLPATVNTNTVLLVPGCYINVSVNTPIYLVVQAAFTNGTGSGVTSGGVLIGQRTS